MKSKHPWLSLAFLTFLLAPAPGFAKTNIGTFDLFNFQLSSLELSLGQRAQAMGKALAGSLPKNFPEGSIKSNNYGGACFKQGKDLTRLSWYDSETEGFRFGVESIGAQKNCPSPFTEGMVFKTYSMDPKTFLPISRGHPTFRLGSTTPAEVKAELGPPEYAEAEKLIYVLRRDKDKEKGCEAETKKGFFYSIEVVFDFTKGQLTGMWLNNHISGEC
ncbi:MAG TPA: hypothetical protein VFW62_02760 [bacterium]|nr:hypothetical protein [bacterium]